MLLHQDADNVAELIKDFKKEIQYLKGRCKALEETIKDLKSARDSHGRILESQRQELIHLKVFQGTLNTDFQGEQFSLMRL